MAAKRRRSRSYSSIYLLTAGIVAGAVVGFVFADRSRFGRVIGRPLERAMSLLGNLRPDDDGDVEVVAADEEFGEFDDDLDRDLDDIDEDDDPDGLGHRVLTAFEQDPVLASRPIEIEETDEGVIRLTGRVPEERDIAHAVTIARGVPGVHRVEQRLRLRQSRSGTSAD